MIFKAYPENFTLQEKEENPIEYTIDYFNGTIASAASHILVYFFLLVGGAVKEFVMGKGAAKYGFKSGVLPTTRSILKNPTIRQETLLEKARASKPKGVTGVGYAEGTMHPKGSHRDPEPMKFIDVEQLIQSTVSTPQSVRPINSKQQEERLRKAELRRHYLSEAFRNEEERLLREEQMLKKKEQMMEEQRSREVALLDQTKSSDLTVPTLERILDEPLMRSRTSDEKELLDMKRKHNRKLMEFKTKEKKLEKLVNLYHVSEEFIVTEKQLQQKVEEAFNNEGSDVLRTKLGMGISRIRSRNEGNIGDALFGTVGGGEYIGFPLIKEYLSGEMKDFAQEVETRSKQIMEEKKNDSETIL
ncbi:related to 37S ribosomal protein PET123,mitochondrial [Zygosaccharomyces bailii ISA1307]|nr:related to 37S ribosomal protein PET123,mitochondrial [Zygosaccharomyces bailii ISA1307]